MIMIEIQYIGTALLLLVIPRIPYQNNRTTRPSYICYCLKRRCFVASYVQPVIQQYKSTTVFAIKENYGLILLQMEAIMCLYTTKLMLFVVITDEWDYMPQRRALVSP